MKIQNLSLLWANNAPTPSFFSTPMLIRPIQLPCSNVDFSYLMCSLYQTLTLLEGVETAFFCHQSLHQSPQLTSSPSPTTLHYFLNIYV